MIISVNRTFIALFGLFLVAFGRDAYAQKALYLPVETTNNALILAVSPKNDLRVAYYGRKLNDSGDYEQILTQYNQTGDYSEVLDAAYTPAGTQNLMEPAVSVVHYDGNTSLALKYVEHESETIDDNVSLLHITLEDPVYDFKVRLFFKSYNKEDIIEQWTEILHNEKKSVRLTKFASGNLYFRNAQYYLTQYQGDWAKEMNPETSLLTHGLKTLDSKLGTRANLFQPSVFMVAMDQPATETEGTVLFGAMEWSGNFKIDFELDYRDNLRLIAGMNNYASEYELKPNEVFETPKFLHTLSHNGKGEASRNLHSWAKDYKILDGNGSRLTLLNNWEATYFDFNEEKLFELLEDTKTLGVDLFLLDDGWFGNKYPRNNDDAGLGDWQANRKKLPNGVASLVKEASKNDVKFGIWIEPEMVNPESELYHKHPDWVIKQPKRDEHYFRNQLVLDLSNPDVQDFVFDVVDELFTENPDLAYIKWDCNAVIYNAYSDHLDKQSHLYIDYVKGLYNVLERIRQKYPVVPMMLCSGGGGRVDYGALQYFTEFWPSDNTDPMERIFMQWEYSYFYPSISVSNHVTEWGKQPLKFRVDVAMMGKLGFDIVIGDLEGNDLKFVQGAVKNYDEVKDIIWHGDLFRLSDPKEEAVASLMYIDESKDQGIIFNYLVNNRYDQGSKRPIKLAGLNPNKKYLIKEINLYPGSTSYINSEKTFSGDFLMKVGFNPRVSKGRESVVLKIESVR
ncbi:alpha-galactosidase [Echinicola shivajiensis]|uniref:alpha-galactosidase n=1 Tax=Echinicola shivajiensis TaxID=1035916 RepID=UPI001BFC17C7|nr:alpha-galactosidase [Echinicola shivajiensis]